ncbi:MAG: hypothetical protein AAGA54_10025 [Myxococcota bacterium]
MRRCLPLFLLVASCTEPADAAPEGTAGEEDMDPSTSTTDAQASTSSPAGTVSTSTADSSSGPSETTDDDGGLASSSGSSTSETAGSSSTGSGLLIEDDTCVKPRLSARELEWVEAFDGIDASIGSGEGYSESDNSLGILGNNQPSIMKGYIEAYLATREFRYLRKLISQGDRILAARDDMTGALDYTGLFNLSIDGTTLSSPETAGSLYQVGSYAMLGTLDPFAHVIAEETMIDVLGVDEPGAWGSAGSLTGVGRLLRYEPG